MRFSRLLVLAALACSDPGAQAAEPEDTSPPVSCFSQFPSPDTTVCRPQLPGGASWDYPIVLLADPWTPENRQRYYRWADKPNAFMDAYQRVMYETPLDIVGFAIQYIPNRFDPSLAETIAAGCKRDYPEWWDRIGCVSFGVHSALRNVKFDERGSDPNNPQHTYCKSHAEAFRVVFDHLGLAHSAVRYLEADGDGFDKGHVANAITVTDPDGVLYEYAIDSGWFPGVLFPLNVNAVRRHDPAGLGRTDDVVLPTISEDPRYFYPGEPQVLGGP